MWTNYQSLLLFGGAHTQTNNSQLQYPMDTTQNLNDHPLEVLRFNVTGCDHCVQPFSVEGEKLRFVHLITLDHLKEISIWQDLKIMVSCKIKWLIAYVFAKHVLIIVQNKVSNCSFCVDSEYKVNW